MTRRELLRLAGAGALGSTIGCTSGTSVLRLGGTLNNQIGFEPDREIALTASPAEVQILAGTPTKVWKFAGRVLKGPAETLKEIDNSYLGPIIDVSKGDKIRIHFSNQLPESSIVHWHGLDIPSAMDGHPSSVIQPGKEFTYEFEVANRAGLYWYHPHPHGRTATQIYGGLAGVFIVRDEEETALKLPSGKHEILCVLQDRQFDQDNQLVYLGSGMPGRMGAMNGFFGDEVLINGKRRKELPLATNVYRFRILNASNARTYRLAWSDKTPITVIGTDGGLLEKPVVQQFVTLAPAQRVDVLLDLSERPIGSTIQLLSSAFPSSEAGSTGMGRGMMMDGGSNSVRNGAALTLLNLRVDRHEDVTFQLPERLTTFDTSWKGAPEATVRRIPLVFQSGQWLLGGRTFEMTKVDLDETVAASSVQIWEIANLGGMMGMQMAHPIHLHGPQFRVLSRVRGPATSLHAGVVDVGWTDTVLVMPGDTVQIQVNFTKHPGIYLYHCHILEHEDMGMMRNFRVTPK
ncbi:multicopper oxidase domain-containing protein [soil metagenome]